MVEIREIITGAFIAIGVILCICAVLYGPDYIREISYPAKQRVQLIAIGKYSLRDWGLRLREETAALPHGGYIQTPIFSAPIKLTDIKYTDNNSIRQIYGQFESQDNGVDIIGKFEASIKDKGPSKLDLEILSGKITTLAATLTRMSGQLSFIENVNTGLLEGNIQAGSINYGGLPFGGTQMRFKGDRDLVGTEITTFVSGHQGTTIKILGGFEQGQLQKISGNIEIDNLQGLIETLNMLASDRTFEVPAYIRNFTTFHLSFEQEPTDDNTTQTKQFNLLSNTLGGKFKGIAAFMPEKKSLKLGGRMQNVWPETYPYGLKKISGDTYTQGVIELSLNQQDDDVYGPYATAFKDLTLKKGDLELRHMNGSITYPSLIPIEIGPSNLTIETLHIADDLKDVHLSLASEDGLIVPSDMTATWKGVKLPLSVEVTPENDQINFYAAYDFNGLSNIAHILLFDAFFSGKVSLKKSWELSNGRIEERPLSLKNATPGILILNEDIPELSHIFAKNLNITLDSAREATLRVNGRLPTLYGKTPVTLESKIERFVEE